VRDEQERHVEVPLQRREQLEDLCLNGHVQGRGRLVRDEEGRFARHSHRDHRPLLHASGEFVRVGPAGALRIGHADALQQSEHFGPQLPPVHAAMRADRFSNLVSHPVNGVEGGHRFLEDHRDLGAADGA
jgi:hypothetical protein